MSASAGNPGEIGAGANVRTDPGTARAEDVRQLASNLGVGSRLWSSATAFVFMAFLFAFFYLRAVNSAGLWRPKHVTPVQGYGLAVLILIILSAVAFDVARRNLVGGQETGWRQGAVAAVVLAVLVIVAQILEYTAIKFTTADGGWASVFWGWTAVQLLWWLGALYWMETLVAQTLRKPPAAAREGTAGVELLRPQADACVVFLYTMAIIAVIAYILLYLVK